MTDPLNIEEGRALERDAPEGPWFIDGPEQPFGIYSKPEWDSGESAYVAEARANVTNLIVWMRNNLSALLDAAEERDRLRRIVAAAVMTLRTGEIGWVATAMVREHPEYESDLAAFIEHAKQDSALGYLFEGRDA